MPGESQFVGQKSGHFFLDAQNMKSDNPSNQARCELPNQHERLGKVITRNYLRNMCLSKLLKRNMLGKYLVC